VGIPTRTAGKKITGLKPGHCKRQKITGLKPGLYKGLRLGRTTLAGLRLRALAGRILLVVA
jgi:hypothetical protein